MSLGDMNVGLHRLAGVRPRKLWYHTAEHEYVVPFRVMQGISSRMQEATLTLIWHE